MDFCERFAEISKPLIESFLESLATEVNPLKSERENTGKETWLKIKERELMFELLENFEKRAICLLDNIDKRSQSSNFDFIAQFLDTLNGIRNGFQTENKIYIIFY